MANSEDPDQTPRSALSDLDLHCLQRLHYLQNQVMAYTLFEYYQAIRASKSLSSIEAMQLLITLINLRDDYKKKKKKKKKTSFI